MASNVRQHFVPASYLQFWADPQERNGRMFRFDGRVQTPTTPHDVCKAANFYSAEDRDAEAALWQPSEGWYPKFVRDFFGNPVVTEAVLIGLAAFASELHYRNHVYANESGEERLALMSSFITAGRLWDFAGFRFKDGESFPANPDGIIADALRQHWRCNILSAPTSHVITSDNPALRFAFEDEPTAIALYALPLTPLHWAFVFDTRRIEWASDNPSDDDLALLRYATAALAIEQVFSRLPLEEREQNHVRPALLSGEFRGALQANAATTLAITPPETSLWRRRVRQPSP